MRYWVFVVALAGIFTWQHRTDIQRWINPPAPLVLPAGFEVVLYSTEWCGYCAKTRRLLKERNVPFRDYDIEKSQEGLEQYEKLDGQGVPVLVIKDEVIHGFDEEAIESALQKL